MTPPGAAARLRAATIEVDRVEVLVNGTVQQTITAAGLEETPLGHYTTFALLPWLLDVTTDHFRKRFGLRRRLGGGGAPGVR